MLKMRINITLVVCKKMNITTEIELTWDGSRFVCEDKKVQNYISIAASFALLQNKTVVTEFLQRCDFQLIGYKYDNGFKIQKSEEVFLDIADEGTGFNILFNLAAISYIKNKKTGKFDVRFYLFSDHKNIDRIYINSASIKSNLHPLLFDRISKNMGLRCKFLSPKDVRVYLKCAVNPSGNCGTCCYFEPDENGVIQFR
jgi:hypothetical protein